MTRFVQKLRLEFLETRALLSTCYVTRPTDLGAGKGFRGDLRYCITKANAEPGEDLIIFQPTAYGTINLTGALPDLTDDLIIAGPGAGRVTIRRHSGGDYRILTVPAGVTAHVYSVTLTNGRSGTGAGVRNDGTLTLGGTVLTSNFDATEGGGVFNTGQLAMFESSVVNNGSLSLGGGIYNSSTGVVSLFQSQVVGNFAAFFTSPGGVCKLYGGGVANYGTMTLTESAVSANSLIPQCGYANLGYGGGIANYGSLTLEYATVSSNWSQTSFPSSDEAHGLGIYSQGDLTVHSSLIFGNFVTGSPNNSSGGGIDHGSGMLSIINSTISGNSLLGFSGGNGRAYGGGIYAAGGQVTILNSTIAGNTSTAKTTYGGGISIHNATLRNTIVAGNQASNGADVFGNLVASGYNLIGQSAGGTGYGPTDLLNVNPLLGPLAENGGPTKTMALLPGSPAIDSGDNTDAPEWDQRGEGFPRIANGTIDRGAFEVQPFYLDPLSAMEMREHCRWRWDSWAMLGGRIGRGLF